ncbi:methyltransferase domain-containing protein [uncultured Roseibium sp.]|uniref:protein-L-isoaspartate O-methyltransferase family protein n=1 Tax=uncultured Roseibium sp. TaxID=1936171 RepID=UPI0026304AAE|nr:methyltransferase domain-containing protein [uncultured Roseibium sp.]
MTPEELAIVRSAFAKQICATAGVDTNNDIERAFSRVHREDFLGSDPWRIVDLAHAPIQLAENDPVYAYQDALFVLSSARGVNNGSPSLHARMLGALAPKTGETVVHLGAGTGYYTALLAELVGPDGHVVAVELDDTLAQIARPALESRANVTFHVDDAAAWPKGEVDGIYVNFAVLAPLEKWIEGLAPNGRLVIPLGVPGKPNRPAGPRFSRHGAAFLIQRCTAGFSASRICQAFFIHAEGGAGSMNRQEVERLQDAFRRPGIEFVQSLIWQRPSDPTRCWFSTPNWALSYDPIE